MVKRVQKILCVLVLGVAAVAVASPAIAGEWAGDWQTSTGFWVGTIKYCFENPGAHPVPWTEAEKTVLREAISEWEDLADSAISFEEVACEDADVTFRWAVNQTRDGEALGENTAGIMTAPLTPGGAIQPGAAPSGVDFHSDPSAGWYVDDDPSTNEPIPSGKWDLLSVAKHEIGHVLGFKHTKDQESMGNWRPTAYGGPGDRQRLAQSDRDAATKLYPTPTPAPTPTPVGGIAELPVDGPDAPRPADGSGSAAPLYAALAAGLAAILGVAAGGWYAWRRRVR